MDPDADEDWFGNPLHVDGGRLTDPVPCPHCEASFRRSPDFVAHLAAAHAVAARPGRRRLLPPVDDRLRRWLRSLRFLPLWYVLPMNAAATLLLLRLWGSELTMMSFDSQLPVLKTWIVRFSILPSVLVLTWRVIDKPH